MTQLPEIPAHLLERALTLLATDEEIAQDPSLGTMMARMTASKDDLKGEVEAEIREGIESEYELEADGGLKLELNDLATEKKITIGVGPAAKDVWIRWLVNKDFQRYSSQIPPLVRLIYKRGPSTLQDLSPVEFLQDLYTAAHAHGMGKLKQALYHELGQCLLDEHGQRIPWQFFEDFCIPSDIWTVIQEVYQENHRFFIGLWACLPGDIRTPLAMTFGMAMKHIKSLAQMSLVLAQSFDGIGTTPPGGSKPSPIQSLLSMAGSPLSSILSRFRRSGASESPSDAATTEPVTSAGSTANGSETTLTSPAIPQEVEKSAG